MARTVETAQDELTSHHRAAVKAVAYVFVLTLALTAVSFTGALALKASPAFYNSLRIVIGILFAGAVVLRRTMFSAMRLRDIGALGGPPALLRTLYMTTVRVVIIAAVIALLAFVISLATRDPADMVWHGLIAVVVLVYAYPRRAAWQSVLRAAAADAAQPDASDSSDARPAKGTIA